MSLSTQGNFERIRVPFEPAGVTSGYHFNARYFGFWSYSLVTVISREKVERCGGAWLERKLYRFRRYARKNCGYCKGHCRTRQEGGK